jgi:hypothetical protein
MFTKDDDRIDLAVFSNNNLFLIMVAENVQKTYSFNEYHHLSLYLVSKS